MMYRRSSVILAVAAVVSLLGSEAGAQVQSKCLVSKNKCVAKKAAALLKCEQKAETPGKDPDPNAGECVEKAMAKFDGGTNPENGCFAKLEAKSPNDCVTFDDTAAAELLTDSCVDDIVAAIDPPPLDQSKCGVSKKKCVAKKLNGLLKCYQKAETPGKSSDPNYKGCITKVIQKFEGTEPAKGCFAKAEAKKGNDCLPPLENTGAVEAVVDQCVNDLVALLTTPTTTTSTVPTTSTTTSSTTTVPTTTTTTTTAPTTTTTTTTTTAPTTTSTTVPTTTTTVPPQFFDFTSTSSTAPCGVVKRIDGSQLGSALTCGSLYLGGGGATVPPNVTPAGATNRFAVTGCAGNNCTLGPTSTAPAVNSATVDCTDTGCNFGTPLPIPAGSTTTCVLNQFSAPVTATLDIAAGTTTDLNIQLSSITYLTANAAQPCPRCQVSPGVPANGSPTAPATGTCDRGARAGLACTSTNAQGLTRDCGPGGTSTSPVRNCTAPCVDANSSCACADGSLFIGPLAINLAPLTTGANARQANVQVGALPNAGFVTGQTVAGCFRSASGYGSTCRRIELNGIPAGSFLPVGTEKPIGFASIFDVPASGNGLVDFAANLPGPGATTVVGTGKLVP